MGESAGGVSVLSHIVQSRSGRTAPFSQAIIQSPGILPVIGNDEPESYLQEFLSILGVGSLTEARKLSSGAIIRANDEAVLTSNFGTFKFGNDGVKCPNEVFYPPLMFSRTLSVFRGINSRQTWNRMTTFVLFYPPFCRTRTAAFSHTFRKSFIPPSITDPTHTTQCGSVSTFCAPNTFLRVTQITFRARS